MRIAFIGTRGHQSTLLKEVPHTAGVQVVGLADGGDSVAAIVDWCAQHGHSPKRFDDHREMLDTTEPDAVVVCGPFERHAEQCIDAIERGVHVMTEKPAAIELHDLHKLQAVCRSHPRVHFAGMMTMRFDSGFFTAKRLIDDGRIGDVKLINGRKSYKLGQRPAYFFDRKTYGGTIPWVGSHAIDWTMWYANAPFKTVSAFHVADPTAESGSIELAAACQFTFGNGVIASVSIDYLRPASASTHGDDWVRVVGTKGVLEARYDEVKLIAANGPETIPVACDRNLLSDFIDGITGRRPPLIDTKSTLALTEACLLARQAADEGRVLSFGVGKDV